MARAARRDVFLTESFDGMYLGQMTMDPLGGTAVFNELARLEQELFEEDWAKAKETLGRDPFVIELCRTYAQRRHDALVRMAIRSATAPSDGRPRPRSFRCWWTTKPSMAACVNWPKARW